MEYSIPKPRPVDPRIIIHGGAGNITRENLPPEAQQKYRSTLIEILGKSKDHLLIHGASALDVATYAVSLLEDNPLFNSGHGAVFNRAGHHELEASIMVSKGYRKRGVGVMKVTKAKNPIKVAREMLIRGEQDDGGGALSHCQLEGDTIDRLAGEWGLELVRPSYFWSRRRWDEHRRALGLSHTDEEYAKAKKEADRYSARSVLASDALCDFTSKENPMSVDETTWDGKEYLPQGTVGAVVLDSDGMVCVATSTGGLTNKLPGRIGDTPTLGAGFWSEQWSVAEPYNSSNRPDGFQLSDVFGGCFPGIPGLTNLSMSSHMAGCTTKQSYMRAVAMSGTGNGDSFLRLSAVRTAAAIARFSGPNGQGSSLYHPTKSVSLQDAVTAVAGPNGMLQQSAEDRWKKTGEGEGGIIGIEMADQKGYIVADFNCGGMFHAWIDNKRRPRVVIFRDEY